MALFDGAKRFESCKVVGDTVRYAKDGTEDRVGPGTYSPMSNSKDFGRVGVSRSRRSNMDPPTSPRSTEYQRHANDCVLRDGVLFHKSPFLASGPGPGSYSPRIISNDHGRGITAKPSSGQTGRQAWDIRGSEGGVPLVYFRGGQTVSSSMGSSPRLADFSRVALRDGVLLLRGTEDGHRSNGIGPGTYDGFSNRQDSMNKRSYNVRAQCRQTRRERSLSFSGTSSSARAYLVIQPPRSPQGAADSRTDYLQVLARRTHPGGGAATPTRSISPASVMLTSMRARETATTAQDGKSGRRERARSASPKRSRKRSPSPPPGLQGLACHTWGSVPHSPGPQVCNHPVERACRSLSPPLPGRKCLDGEVEGRPCVNAQARKVTRDSSISPWMHEPRQSELPYPNGGRCIKIVAPTRVRSKDSSTARGCVDEPFGYDYFGQKGQKDTWRGLDTVPFAPSSPTVPDEPSETVERSEAAATKMEKQDLVELEKVAVALGGRAQPPLESLLLPKKAKMGGVSTPPNESVESPHEQQQPSDISLYLPTPPADTEFDADPGRAGQA